MHISNEILVSSEQLFVTVRADLSELNFFLLLFFDFFQLEVLGVFINLLGDLVEEGEDAGGESAPEGDKDLLDGGQALGEVKLRRGLSGGLFLLEGLSQVLKLGMLIALHPHSFFPLSHEIRMDFLISHSQVLKLGIFNSVRIVLTCGPRVRLSRSLKPVLEFLKFLFFSLNVFISEILKS